MCLCFWLRRSGHKEPGEDLIALPGEGEIFFGDSAFIVRSERQRHLTKTNVDIRMVIDLLGLPGDPVDKIDAFQKSLKAEGATNGLRAFRPVRQGLQLKTDLFRG